MILLRAWLLFLSVSLAAHALNEPSRKSSLLYRIFYGVAHAIGGNWEKVLAVFGLKSWK